MRKKRLIWKIEYTKERCDEDLNRKKIKCG